MTNEEFLKAIQDRDWEPTLAEFLGLSDEQRDDIERHSKLRKVNEETRNRKLLNDIRAAQVVDTTKLLETLAIVTPKVDEVLKREVEDILPLRTYGADSKEEARAAGAKSHKTIKKALAEIWEVFEDLDRA